MLSFLYVYSDHSILECYNLFSGVELSMRSFFVICTVYSHMYAYASFAFHHPCCLPFLKKTVRVASDSSLVKVPDLQPAWMMISITK